MSGTQVFVIIFAVASIGVSLAAVWRVTKTSGFRGKPFWIAGFLFGFIGFSTSLSFPGDLYMSFGLQIPVVMLSTVTGAGTVMKTMFPFVAVAALVKCHLRENAPGI